MARRKKDPTEDIIRAVGGLVMLGVLAFMFVPAFRALLILGVGLAFLCFVSWIAYRLCTKKIRASHDLQVIVPEIPNREPNRRSFPPENIDLHPALEPRLSEKLRAIDWFQFEKLIGAVYQAKGYSVKRIGGANPDGGVDLVIENASEKFVIQCKQWKSWKVGVRQIREFLGTLTDSGIPKGVFITLQGYTDDAKDLANKHGISIMSEDGVEQLLEMVDWKSNPEIIKALNDTRKFCPKCENEMVLRTAKKGPNIGEKFWGCSGYPRCRFILNT